MIRLDRLTVRGFRSIRALEDFEPGDLTVLIGPNGAGKSNFLDLFRMGASIAAERLQIFVAERDGPDALLFGGVGRTDRIDAAFAFHSGEYAFSLLPAGNRLVFEREETREGDGKTRVRPLGGREESRLAEAGDVFASYAAGAMKGWRVHHFADTGPTARLRRAQPLRDNLRLQADGGNLSPFLHMLRERFPLHHRRIVEATRFVAPFLGHFASREPYLRHSTGIRRLVRVRSCLYIGGLLRRLRGSDIVRHKNAPDQLESAVAIRSRHAAGSVGRGVSRSRRPDARADRSQHARGPHPRHIARRVVAEARLGQDRNRRCPESVGGRRVTDTLMTPADRKEALSYVYVRPIFIFTVRATATNGLSRSRTIRLSIWTIFGNPWEIS